MPPAGAAAGAESAEIDDLLRAADAAARLDAPHDAPPLCLPTARWAARILFRACICLADRTVDAAAVTAALGDAAPRSGDASSAWSADLFLRHLPELHGLARGLAPSDPLVAALERLGAEWPLSAVGMRRGAGAAAVPPPAAMARNACLRRLFADRAIRRADSVLLAVPWVAEAVREATGRHADLAPAATAALAAHAAHASDQETRDAR